jgi:ribonuclease Z
MEGTCRPGDIISDLPFLRWIPAAPGMGVPLTGEKRDIYRVYVIECFHTVADVGYVIAEQRHKLKNEFKNLSGKELIKIKSQGIEISEHIDVPLLAYLCDTDANVFAPASSRNEESKRFQSSDPQNQTQELQEQSKKTRLTREEQIAMIFGCSVIMIECTFLEDSMKSEASKRGHLVWSDLREHVEAHPKILFILFHFSQRYTDQEIRKFFETASSNRSRPPNVLLWLDSGIDMPPETPQSSQQESKSNNQT